MNKVRIAVIGAGRMGKLHCRVLSEMPQATLACVVDSAAPAAEAMSKQYKAPVAANIPAAVELADAAIIAVPTAFHLQAAMPFLAAGKSVLIEKPIAPTVPTPRPSWHGREERCVRPGRPHERFNPAVQAIRRFEIARASSRPTASARSPSAPRTWAWCWT